MERLRYKVLRHFPHLAYRLERDRIERAVREVMGERKISHSVSGRAHFIQVAGDVSDDDEWESMIDVQEKMGLCVTHCVFQPYDDEEDDVGTEGH